MSNEVLPVSYVDRGGLDRTLSTLLARKRQHVAVRGASKCGKSWLRRQNIKDPITVQCRLKRTVTDLYIDALSQLEIRLTVSASTTTSFNGELRATGELGLKLLGKVGLDGKFSAQRNADTQMAPVGHDINDLRYIADVLRESGRTVVVEDFHYLSVPERQKLASDLKALWDYGVYFVIVGVWSLDNMLLSLNSDLTGRMEELSVTWSAGELGRVLDQGGAALNVRFVGGCRATLMDSSFENVGILQTLTLRILDLMGIDETQNSLLELSDAGIVQSAAMDYAEQLNPLYQEFAHRVSDGMRRKPNSTGIYAHTMAAIMGANDKVLVDGMDASEIFRVAHGRQNRVQQGNLKQILPRMEGLQVDEDGRGLVLAYNPATEKVSVVDRQLLMYRRYATVRWPWEQMIEESAGNPTAFEVG